MVISNWVEKRLEERRIKREQALFEQGRAEGRAEGHTEGRKEGFEQGRAYERERIAEEANGNGYDEPAADKEDGRQSFYILATFRFAHHQPLCRGHGSGRVRAGGVILSSY